MTDERWSLGDLDTTEFGLWRSYAMSVEPDAPWLSIWMERHWQVEHERRCSRNPAPPVPVELQVAQSVDYDDLCDAIDAAFAARRCWGPEKFPRVVERLEVWLVSQLRMRHREQYMRLAERSAYIIETDEPPEAAK